MLGFFSLLWGYAADRRVEIDFPHSLFESGDRNGFPMIDLGPIFTEKGVEVDIDHPLRAFFHLQAFDAER